MPVAPNLAALLDPGPLVEAACVNLFADITSVSDFGSKEDLAAERIEVLFALGLWANRWGVDRDGNLHHNCWHYGLTIDVWGKRLAEDPARLKFIRGQVAQRLEAAVRTGTFLDFHTIASLNEQGAIETKDAQNDMDNACMRYTGLITVRSDAWPWTDAHPNPHPPRPPTYLQPDGFNYFTPDGGFYIQP